MWSVPFTGQIKASVDSAPSKYANVNPTKPQGKFPRIISRVHSFMTELKQTQKESQRECVKEKEKLFIRIPKTEYIAKYIFLIVSHIQNERKINYINTIIYHIYNL